MTTTYKWANPLDWLLDHITKANLAQAMIIATRLAMELDADTIQDMYQDGMSEDGYFEPVDE